jgi:hypothetical protein
MVTKSEPHDRNPFALHLYEGSAMVRRPPRVDEAADESGSCGRLTMRRPRLPRSGGSSPRAGRAPQLHHAGTEVLALTRMSSLSLTGVQGGHVVRSTTTRWRWQYSVEIA